ncbi:MAG TPA: thioredoxin-like domain-containing protein [Bacteroidales bacterium]|nr:thioredoxin-like domain-containing protein [Bacteroidales bacterium]
MRKFFAGAFCFIFSFLFNFTTCTQGYDIKVRINGLADTVAILGHYVNKSMYPDDTAWLDHNGYGVFKKDKKLPGAMYVVYLPSTRFFQILIDEDQQFILETDTVDFVNSLKVKGSDDNTIFYDFQKFMKTLSEEAVKIQEKINNPENESEEEELKKRLKNLGDERISYINNVIRENPDLFVSTFLKATLDTNVPDPPVLPDGKKDSVWQYYYYRNHYFDNFDYTDSRLLRTPLIEDKVMDFVSKIIPQIPDSIIPYVDDIIDNSKADSNVFRFMLITIFNYFAKSNIMGMDAVYIHLAEKYYIHDSWWSDEKFITDLKERIEKAKPLLIGKKAPDMDLMMVPAGHFIAAENDTTLKRFPHIGSKITLENIDAKYLVVVFWEADCGHCKTVLPQLYEIYEKSLKDKNIEVLAVSTLFGEEGKMKWVDFVNKYKLYEWINTWNPYSYQFKIKYDILSTPQFFILDQDKKIIAKRIGPEQIEPLINAYESMLKQK